VEKVVLAIVPFGWEQLGFARMPAHESSLVRLSFQTSVSGRTWPAIEHLLFGIPSQAQQNKILRAAFRLQVGMSVLQHAS
jgi:hypothetical protein